MPSSRLPAVPPQVEILPGMPPTPFAEVNIDIGNALSRALRPEYLGIRPEDYADITPDLVALANPENFRTSLIDVPRSNNGVISYRSYDNNRLVFVAVTDEEFKLFTGNIKTLGDRAISATRVSRSRPNGLSTEDSAAAERSGAHSVASRLSRMEAYRDNVLQRQNGLIEAFRKASIYPGITRPEFREEADMRMAITTVREDIFGTVFAALRRQRNWTPQQELLAKRLLERRLFINRHDNNHIAEFDAVLALAAERNGHVIAIAASKMYQAKQYLASKTQYAG